jgi:hypothetical protein
MSVGDIPSIDLKNKDKYTYINIFNLAGPDNFMFAAYGIEIPVTTVRDDQNSPRQLIVFSANGEVDQAFAEYSNIIFVRYSFSAPMPPDTRTLRPEDIKKIRVSSMSPSEIETLKSKLRFIHHEDPRRFTMRQVVVRPPLVRL